ncbi:MAG: hypothetical protein KUG69_12515 [Marinosulfonomonas sp.]|nr:hypothetical protein [Marinosulfonomonas sp.]
MYHYELLHPNQIPEPDPHRLGIEVTVREIAATCRLGNIDPQHGPQASAVADSAIVASLDWPLPPNGATMVTIRPDADAFGAMAVLTMRSTGVDPNEAMLTRIARIDAADRFDRGPWPGARPLPRTIDEILDSTPDPDIAILGALSTDRSLSPSDRVAAIGLWLREGEVPQGHKAALRRNAKTILQSLRFGATRIGLFAGEKAAKVVSLECGALKLGYCLAPVVIALNPGHKFCDGTRGQKYTIAQYQAGHLDLHAVAEKLSRHEAGWGGSATIKGSPQGLSSRLSLDCIEKVVSTELSPEP